MDFIVVCPYCGAYIGVDESVYTDLEFYFIGGRFCVNGEMYCNGCGKSSVLDIELEPIEYKISEMEEE